MKKLKLYVWENVLTYYTSGVMFAFAENEDHARRLICKTAGCEITDKNSTVVGDLQSKPQEYNIPVGFAFWGGA
jgi:hypothetical protein